jgi:FAD/FMN-containing dehydrogenase
LTPLAPLDGEVLQPGSPEYEVARRPPIARFDDLRPEAIVRCRTASDVAAAIAFARAGGLAVVPRSGGHCFAGRSSTEGLLIDLGPMDAVSLEGGAAVIGAGARLGQVYDALAAHGLTIAAGCGPTVGIAGLTLGGGLGILGRTHGLTSDQLLGAEVVLADGSALEVDAERDNDLFWALRGSGGGRFGVVTRLTLRTVPAPPMTTLHLTWPMAHAARAIAAWQEWSPDGPDELAASLLVTAEVHLFGAVAGTESCTRELLGGFVDGVGADPASARLEHMSYRDAKRHLAEHGPGDETEAAVNLSKSEFFRGPLPAEAITALVEHAQGPRGTLDFSPWGGAYNRVAPDATAFPHRAERFLLKHDVAIPVGAPEAERRDARAWLARSWDLVHPWGSGGAYVNFPDADLDDWDPAYHGPNRDRLLGVGATYDPDGVFRSCA